MEREKRVSFTSIFLKVPRKKIIKALKKDSIDSKEYGFFFSLHTKTQKITNKSEHLRTVLECLLRKNLTINRKEKNVKDNL